MTGPRIFWFDDRGVSIDHITLLHTPGYHTATFTVRDREGNCTLYVAEVESALVGSLKPRDLARHVFELMDERGSASVIKQRFKENPP
jgi:hypothetical protein